ncbi:MAG: hypothetical protein FWG02_07435 [Holophagaceae bacterium]|nr:hypothetical protein [Holophagaceae bacterium]
MAKALGVGGIFFKSQNPGELLGWYQKWLGFPSDFPSHVMFSPTTMPPNSCTVFSPFPSDTDYFEPSDQQFMFNLIVDNLAQALEQVKAGGATLVGDIQSLDYGTFGWFVDPEGNKVELWEPSK